MEPHRLVVSVVFAIGSLACILFAASQGGVNLMQLDQDDLGQLDHPHPFNPNEVAFPESKTLHDSPAKRFTKMANSKLVPVHTSDVVSAQSLIPPKNCICWNGAHSLTSWEHPCCAGAFMLR